MNHDTHHCLECGHDTVRTFQNRLGGVDGWAYVCPQCEPDPAPPEPTVPDCIQCGQAMTRSGAHDWICDACCWTCDHTGQWAHDTLRLATRMLNREHNSQFTNIPEAYCAGFLTAWGLALRLCQNVESRLA